MKVLIAPDKFKGSLTAKEVCEAACRGLKKAVPDCQCIFHPLADGGEGTLTALDDSLELQTIELTVNDPLFRPVRAAYKLGNDAAYIEMSRASGLQLLTPDETNCMETTSYGTGELMLDAINRGVNHLYLFIGGSATNDAAMGLAAALGYKFLDPHGAELSPVGKHLTDLHSINDQSLAFDREEVEVTVVCDVKNPLFGPLGAAHVYGPQKGASPEEVAILDQGLINFNQVIINQYNADLSGIEGGGAAGGIGAGAVGLLNAKIQPGIESVIDITSFASQVNDVDFIITGEGKLDNQTIQGKVVNGVYDIAQEMQIPLYIICGIAENLDLVKAKIMAPIHQLKTSEITVEEAISNAAQLVEERAFQIMQDFKSS